MAAKQQCGCQSVVFFLDFICAAERPGTLEPSSLWPVECMTECLFCLLPLCEIACCSWASGTQSYICLSATARKQRQPLALSLTHTVQDKSRLIIFSTFSSHSVEYNCRAALVAKAEDLCYVEYSGQCGPWRLATIERRSVQFHKVNAFIYFS